MRKATESASLVLATLLFLSPTLTLGQTGGADTKENFERQFAAVDASLLAAADTAIEATAAQPSRANSIDYPPQTQFESVPLPTEDTSSGRTRNGRLDALVQPILAGEGVPNQLEAVIQVESGGNPLALSPKGARGLWQLMPDTARRYGLRVDSKLDERIDLEKSTTTAARYLRDLYVQFGSWPLALAAYNTGEQNLQKAIDRARSRDFPTLSALGYLSLETRNYVPAVLSVMRSKFPSSVAPAERMRQTQFAYATSEESGR
jgi:soluble lytic murein transglycosylase-like protein